MRSGVMSAVDSLAELGADIDEVSLPISAQSGAVFLATADVDAATFHLDWLKTRGDLYDWSTRTRLESAVLTPATTYLRGQRARTLIKNEMMSALEDHDVDRAARKPHTCTTHRAVDRLARRLLPGTPRPGQTTVHQPSRARRTSGDIRALWFLRLRPTGRSPDNRTPFR